MGSVSVRQSIPVLPTLTRGTGRSRHAVRLCGRPVGGGGHDRWLLWHAADVAEWEDDVVSALVEEACKKSALVWVELPGHRSRPAWHAWHEGAVCLVTGGREQELPGIQAASQASVTARSKDKGGRLVTFRTEVEALACDDEEYAGAVAVLHAARLNAHDGEEQPARWARESQLWRLVPTGEVPEQPGAMPVGSQAAPPPPSPATTRGALPLRIGRRPRRRRTG